MRKIVIANFSPIKLLLLNIAIGLGTFIQVLDTSIANVAIPYIAGSLSVSADQGTWVITSFSASNAIILPLTGWLTNFFGRVRLFVWSVILFSLTSFLCGLANNLSLLVFLRVVQGAVAGSLIPLSQSLIMVSNPVEKQGTALGFWAMIVIVAPVIGPILGGYLTSEYSWPWIFYINVPIGIFSAAIVWIFLKEEESEIQKYPIDWIGLTLLVIGIGSLQILLDKGKDLDWYESNVIIGLNIVSIIALLYFTVWSYFQKHPIIDFSFFKNKNFMIGTICVTLGFFIYFGSTVTVPLWLQTEQGYDAFWAGVAVSPIGIAPLFLSPLLGKWMGKIDLRHLVTTSFLFYSLSFFYQSHFTTQVDLYTVMKTRFFQGFGVAFFFLPLTQLSLSAVKKEQLPAASGLFHFIRILFGSSFGTSLAIEAWNRLTIFHHARLAETLTFYNPLTLHFYQTLQNYSEAFKNSIVARLLEQLTEQQASMLALNDLASIGGWMFLALIPLVYLAKNSKSSLPASASPAH